ncbi:hypothetical protein WA588_001659 [Blastocystis sp. NMH]
MEPLYPERPIHPFTELTSREQSIVDNQRMVVSAIQKSPYYIELEDANMHFERYTDKYTKEKDNTKLASFYSYDILSKYIPTELLGDKSRKEIHSMRLNIRHANHTEVGNDKEDKEDGGDNANPQEGDDLNQDVVYEDEENEYEMNFEVSEDSFGMNDDDGDDGPVY